MTDRVPDEDFKRAAAAFPSGVAVVTSGHGDVVHGITVSAFSSLSLDPPQVLVCVSRWSKLNDMVHSSNKFAVSILATDQAHLGDLFARPGRDPVASFADIAVPHELVGTGSPVIAGSAAFFDCSVVMACESGDHSVFFGDVLRAGANEDKQPLLYYHRQYRRMVGIEPGAH
jgi:flavin reductase (DIM6/NTAB) family NADH-FMN oxidoreductase RutF